MNKNREDEENGRFFQLRRTIGTTCDRPRQPSTYNKVQTRTEEAICPHTGTDSPPASDGTKFVETVTGIAETIVGIVEAIAGNAEAIVGNVEAIAGNVEAIAGNAGVIAE